MPRLQEPKPADEQAAQKAAPADLRLELKTAPQAFSNRFAKALAAPYQARMQCDDLRSLDATQDIETDLCIVGSGPAGLTLAGEFAGTRVRTLVVESGGLTENPDVDQLSRFESVGAPRVMDYGMVRNRIFGGTSHTWTGRCAPFDDIDFAVRSWVPHSGWPLSRSDLEPYLVRAADYLGLVPSFYDERLWDMLASNKPPNDIDKRILQHCFWQYSSDPAQPLDYMRFGRAFLTRAAPNIRALLHATVTHVTTNAAGTQLVSVEAAALDGKRVTIRTKRLVLCAGGIDNARILLMSNRLVAKGVGNSNDLVGRFLMDHPRCSLAEFATEKSSEIRKRYGLFRVGERRQRQTFVQGLTLSPAYQERNELLNCAAWITEDRAEDDPWEAAKRLLSGERSQPLRDAWSIVSQPHFVARGLRSRLFQARGVPHKLRRLMLDCIVEQRPDPASRVSLSDQTDSHGLPIARLDWRISEQEKATVAAFGKAIYSQFKSCGLAAPGLAEWVANDALDRAEFIDVSHPTGCTRMADDPKLGVVDANCQLHEVDGIYVAGSSVFPTSGHANPTLMIVAMAIRLADWLKRA